MVKKESIERQKKMIAETSIKHDTVAAYTLVALLAGTAVVYFLAASEELPEVNEEQAAVLESILFLGSGIGYVAVGGWIVLNLRHGIYNKLPYMLAIGGSTFLIVLYVVSRTLALPTVGLQTDVGTLDTISKVLQCIIIALSAYVMLRARNLERSRRELHA